MLRNIIGTFFTKGAVAFILLLNLLLSTRYLGSAVVGQWSLLLLSVAIVHAFSEIYTGSALVYFIPKHRLSQIYFKGIIWSLITALVLSLVYFLFDDLNGIMLLHVFVLSLLTSLSGFHNYLLLGREKIRIYNVLLFMQPALALLVLYYCIFMLDYRGLNAPLTAWYVSLGVTLLVSSVAVLKTVETCSNSKGVPFKEVIGKGFLNQLGNLSHILSNRYNFYVIKALSFSLVGVYASSSSLIEAVLIISASVSPLVLTHIANARDLPNNARVTLLMGKLCFVLSFCCVLILYFIPAGFFTELLGKDFSQTKEVMLYLSPGVLALSFSSVISHYFSGLGEQKKLLTANACGLLITLASSYFMVQRFGLKGACITASAAYLVQSILLTIYFFSQKSGTIIAKFCYAETRSGPFAN